VCDVVGTEANPGLVPRALDVVFNSVKHRLCRDASVKPRFYCDATQLSARELIEEMKIKHAVMKAAAEEVSIVWVNICCATNRVCLEFGNY
jgi:hypothetical protein